MNFSPPFTRASPRGQRLWQLLLGFCLLLSCLSCRQESADPSATMGTPDASVGSRAAASVGDVPRVAPQGSETKSGDDPSPGSLTGVTHEQAPAAVDRRAGQETRVFATPQLDPGDAAAEGWQGEAFTERANAQLKRLIDWINDPGTASSELFATDLRCTSLLPTLETVFESHDTVVEQARPQQATVASTSADAAFASLRAAYVGTGRQPTHGKFKLYRVQAAQGDEVVTEQFFHLDIRKPEAAVEHNATWVIRWDASHDQRPLIREIKVVQAEQVLVRRTGSGRLDLVDCTASLFGDSETYRDCLLPGIPDWMGRVEVTRGVYKTGHHGLTVGDVNGDGLDDVYICQMGGLPNHLLLQTKDGRLRDVSMESGTAFFDNTRSALLVDLDNDRDQDLVVALATGLLLLENDGSGSFRQRARISSLRQVFSLAAADYDNDQRLDLFACGYYGQGQRVSDLPLPLPYFDATNGGENYLIRNVGDWKFSNVTEEVGLGVDNHRFSFAASWEDEDNDGDVDLYVVNDFGPNQLFRNEGGKFVVKTDAAGLIDGAFGMSAAFGDYNRDGKFDIYVSNMYSAAGNRITFDKRFKPGETDDTIDAFRYLARGNSLFQNNGDGTYREVSDAAGVAMGRWSWASLFCDLNNDGWEDLLVANGYLTGEQTDDL